MTSLSVFYVGKFETPSFSLFATLATAFRRNRTITALNTLSDRQLSDIGIQRSNINSFVEANIK